MRFPPHFLERLRGHFLLSEFIGRRVPLRRHGREFMGLCPFHKEKSPSFTVNDEKRFFHCFGCGAHGDAIGFLMDYEGMSYPEAVEKLAGEAGIALPEITPEEMQKARRAASLYDIMEEAARWFEAQLASSSGREGLQYLDERGLTRETRAQFRLGFAPNLRHGLKQALLARGISEAAMIEAGLLIKPDTGETYDRFRARVMFPIRDLQGRVIAFGGRVLASQAEKVQAKYLNSPETPLFHKGEILFNADLARKAAHDEKAVVVVEGYMDVIALHQAGIRHAVAPLGTAVTPPHLQLLWRMAPEPIFCLDGDAAGKRAMARAAELALPLLKPGTSLRFVTLPQKEDPDSMVRRHGAVAMRKYLDAARTLAQSLWELNVAEQVLDTPERKAAAEHRLMQLAETIADKTVKAHYRTWFREKLWPKSPGRGGKIEGKTLAAPLLFEQSTLRRFEQQLLKLVLLHPHLLQSAENEENFARLEFANTELDKLRHATLEVLGYSEATERAQLHAALAQQGLETALSALLGDDSVPLPRIVLAQEAPPAQVEAIWRQAVGAYTLAKMEEEYRHAAAAMAMEMTEEAFARCRELQLQIEALRRAQAFGDAG